MLSYWKYSRTRASAQKLWHDLLWKREMRSLLSVIPDIFYQESILVFRGWTSDDNYGHDDRYSLRLEHIPQYHCGISVH